MSERKRMDVFDRCQRSRSRWIGSFFHVFNDSSLGLILTLVNVLFYVLYIKATPVQVTVFLSLNILFPSVMILVLVRVLDMLFA